MIRTDSTFVSTVARAVADAERGTSAELVVVVAARSGPYRDLAAGAGAVAALAVLLVALFAPPLFPPLAVAVEIPAVFALVAWLTHRLPGALRAMASGARMKRQVERAAAWWFLEEAVHGTRARTGMLVYLSLLENRAAILPDLGLSGAIPDAAWSGIAWRADGTAGGPRTVEEVVIGIAAIGALLREKLPADARDVNELPDAPRIVT
jgi:putative membrane protein